jgi:hypothetical protein
LGGFIAIDIGGEEQAPEYRTKHDRLMMSDGTGLF